jgi:hypothetical protein
VGDVLGQKFGVGDFGEDGTMWYEEASKCIEPQRIINDHDPPGARFFWVRKRRFSLRLLQLRL